MSEHNDLIREWFLVALASSALLLLFSFMLLDTVAMRAIDRIQQPPAVKEKVDE